MSSSLLLSEAEALALGLPGVALMGGWTFKGFTAWAQGLEAEIAMLKANIDSSPSVDEWRAKDGEINRMRILLDDARDSLTVVNTAYVRNLIDCINKALTPNV